MGSSRVKKLISVIVCAIVIVGVLVAYDQTRAAGNDPGSIADPLVSKSYVDQMNAKLLAQIAQLQSTTQAPNTTGATPNNMTEIYAYIDNKFSAIAQNGVSVTTGFIVVEVAAGQKLICEGSTELILRTGEAKVVANAAGDGLTDTTAGIDVKGGMSISSNHLLIVPRSDGRGLSVSKKSYIMVKGNYAIQ